MRVASVTSVFLVWIGLATAVTFPTTQTALVAAQGLRLANLLIAPDWDYNSAWKILLENKDKAVAYANRALEENGRKFNDAAEKINHFKEGMNRLVEQAQEIALMFETYQADPQALVVRLDDVGTKAIERLQKEFEKPLPEDMDDRAKYRAEMVTSVLNHMEGPYVTVSLELGVPEERARDSFQSFRRLLEEILTLAGKIVDEHPELIEAIIIAAVFLMLPEAFFLRTFLRLFGFGPFGPAKGSLAAWLQSRFWGGVVARGSWFAWMQRAGMVKSWWSSILSILRAIAALFGF